MRPADERLRLLDQIDEVVHRLDSGPAYDFLLSLRVDLIRRCDVWRYKLKEELREAQRQKALAEQAAAAEADNGEPEAEAEN